MTKERGSCTYLGIGGGEGRVILDIYISCTSFSLAFAYEFYGRCARDGRFVGCSVCCYGCPKEERRYGWESYENVWLLERDLDSGHAVPFTGASGAGSFT